MQTPSVCVIILQYNNSQDTMRCLNYVKELDYPNYRVIIVDNGSEVNHINEIRNWIEKVDNFNLTTHYSLLTTHSNLGYSGGNNIGIRQALNAGVDYVLILNPDATIEKGALTKLVDAGESEPQTGIIGPAINENGKIIYGGKIEWLKPELSHNELPTTNYQLPTNYYIPGAAMLIKKNIIEKIGLLDERYFLYFEDADYCLRTTSAGYKLAIAPEALIYHKPSSSTSSLGSALLLRYHYRNAHLFNYKNGPLWVKLCLPFWSILITIKQLAKICMTPSKRIISFAILGGILDFYKQKFGNLS